MKQRSRKGVLPAAGPAGARVLLLCRLRGTLQAAADVASNWHCGTDPSCQPASGALVSLSASFRVLIHFTFCHKRFTSSLGQKRWRSNSHQGRLIYEFLETPHSARLALPLTMFPQCAGDLTLNVPSTLLPPAKPSAVLSLRVSASRLIQRQLPDTSLYSQRS